MKLVLQCAMCGTHHPVGTPACTTCHASGVTHLRLMFECPKCARLGLEPLCPTCGPAPPTANGALLPYEVVDDFIPVEIVEEVDVEMIGPDGKDLSDVERAAYDALTRDDAPAADEKDFDFEVEFEDDPDPDDSELDLDD